MVISYCGIIGTELANGLKLSWKLIESLNRLLQKTITQNAIIGMKLARGDL